MASLWVARGDSRWVRFDGKARGLPSGEATGDFSGGGETVALEEAGGYRRAVATGAINEQRTIFGELGQIFGQFGQGKAQAVGDEFLFAFAGRTYVHGERRLIGGQEFGGELHTEMFGDGDSVGAGCEGLQTVL